MSTFMQAGRPPLILASTSKSRARILEAAGLAFIVEPPGVDESVMRQAVSGERSLEPHDGAVGTKGETIWSETEIATLTMRKLSPEFIGRYLAAAGEEVLGSVGAYQIESLGIQLFDRIEGDYFTNLVCRL